jgi:hypothetical protein
MECTETKTTITAYINPAIEAKPGKDAVGRAEEHIRRCKTCREEMGSEARGRFIHSLVLDRE